MQTITPKKAYIKRDQLDKNGNIIPVFRLKKHIKLPPHGVNKGKKLYKNAYN
jgi:hypothetical protein